MNISEARALNKQLKEKREATERAKAQVSVTEAQMDKSIKELGEILGEEVNRKNLGQVVSKQTALLEAQKAAIESCLSN